MSLLEHLTILLEQAKIIISDEQKDKLINYINLLNKWNKTYNLTAITDPDAMLVKHVIDSVVVSPYLMGKRFIDVGSGAGLPGIPLSIILPKCHFTLLDSLGKRIWFLKQVQQTLFLTNIDVVKSRVEFYTNGCFDAVISRAFASIKEMLALCSHLVQPGNYFFALKGTCPDEELKQLPAGFQLESIFSLTVPELNAQRHLIVIKKQ